MTTNVTVYLIDADEAEFERVDTINIYDNVLEILYDARRSCAIFPMERVREVHQSESR